jgi:hypothetical protein
VHLLGSGNDVLQKRSFFILRELVKEQTSDLSVQMEFSQSEEEQDAKYINNDLFQQLMNVPSLYNWDITSIEEKVN